MPSAQRITPDGCPELIMHFGDGCRRLDRGREVEPRAFLIGPLRSFVHLQPLGRTDVIGIRFRPGGLAPFLGAPVLEVTDGTFEVESLFGRPGKDLYERLANTACEHRLGLARELLPNYLAARYAPHPAVVAASAALLESPGEVRLEDAQRAAGISSRQLQRLFGAQIGFSPKHLARIVRFQRLLGALHHIESPVWAQLAVEHGYFDQAHLSHEFQRLAGTTPGRFVREDRPMNDVFVSSKRMSDSYNTGAGPLARLV